jgi:hypothetical protein
MTSMGLRNPLVSGIVKLTVSMVKPGALVGRSGHVGVTLARQVGRVGSSTRPQIPGVEGILWLTGPLDNAPAAKGKHL